MDDGRKERTLRLPEGPGRNASVAASLLLQFAVETYREKGPKGSGSPVQVVSAEEVMVYVSRRGAADFAYTCGAHGKPSFADPELPHFNLSHSAEYVAVVLSERECGIDLQKEDPRRDVNSIAERFFAPEEAKAVRRDGSETFFRLWTRKEALAKCYGLALASMLETDLLDPEAVQGGSLFWTEWRGLPGYYLTACEKRQ